MVSTRLTNPRIIDRLEQDVTDYLSSFGFSFHREQIDGSSSLSAILSVPHKLYNYASPLGTLHLHVHHESLLSTVGPLLRSYLRLSPSHINPLRLRAVVHCHFELDVLEKFDKMSSEQKRTQLARQEELSTRRMLHHVHMLVRNSMGVALCIQLILILPYYLRRELRQGEDEKQYCKHISTTKSPILCDRVLNEMNCNPDACYPSIRLVGVDGEGMGQDENTISNPAIHLDVNTRMCTVRHQPTIFQWLHSLQCASEGGRSQSEIERISTMKLPLIVLCIEKVGNLQRILMLCHDFEKKLYQCVERQYGREISWSLQTTLMPDVVVVLPNSNDDKLLRAFEAAAIDFRRAIVGLKEDTNFNTKEPTFVYEEHSREKIHALINQGKKKCPEPSIIGIDLHSEALTLHGDYTTNVSPALLQMRNAESIVFGYESTGIPDVVASELNGWVQIPSRSSINVVAATSIVLDALIVGAGTITV